jgi:hypothetical protein
MLKAADASYPPFLCLCCWVVAKEKKANLKIVKYLHFLLAGYAEFINKAKLAAKM